ncbi:MAG: hypothetical protein IJI21_06735, partial [Clostridia bacterium]|nr:hypothetical protein [Clostridia bacterium]
LYGVRGSVSFFAFRSFNFDKMKKRAVKLRILQSFSSQLLFYFLPDPHPAFDAYILRLFGQIVNTFLQVFYSVF